MTIKTIFEYLKGKPCTEHAEWYERHLNYLKNGEYEKAYADIWKHAIWYVEKKLREEFPNENWD